MIRRLIKFIIIFLMILGIILGVRIALKKNSLSANLKKTDENVINKIQQTNAELLEFYTYGRTLNIKGRIPRVNKENIENVKLYITNGLSYEKSYNLDYSIENNNLIFDSSNINDGLILDELETNTKYYVLLRLKLNNSVNPRFFSFNNMANYNEINYYTMTQDSKNKLAKIGFTTKTYKKEDYQLLVIELEETNLPNDIYDIVIDAGHGGKDEGEKNSGYTEANINLDYAYDLKEKLESLGYKVKLTRTKENSEYYDYKNMYDINGRITVACETRAKLMISFHVNNGTNTLRGFEIYSPPKSKFDLASKIANSIKESSNLEYSNSENYKKADGVYLRNFSKNEIYSMTKNAEKKGYEPYNITENTPYLYTIREVGGIATGAYADGRNKEYSKNEYYNSNQGIECYQIELGYIKNDLQIILEEKDKITEAIAKTISEYYK